MYKFNIGERVNFVRDNFPYSNGLVERSRHTETDSEPQYLIIWEDNWFSISESDVREIPAKTYTLKELKAAVLKFYQSGSTGDKYVTDFIKRLEAHE